MDFPLRWYIHCANLERNPTSISMGVPIGAELKGGVKGIQTCHGEDVGSPEPLLCLPPALEDSNIKPGRRAGLAYRTTDP